MNTHLEDHEITAAVAGLELDPWSASHLATCLSCRRRVAAFEGLLSERRIQLEGEAPDWTRQRRSILQRLPVSDTRVTRRTQRWWRPVLAAAAVLLAAVAVTLFYLPSDGVPAARVVDEEIQVEEILAAVDALLDDDTTPGFEALDQLVPGSEELEDYYQHNGAS